MNLIFSVVDSLLIIDSLLSVIQAIGVVVLFIFVWWLVRRVTYEPNVIRWDGGPSGDLPVYKGQED